MTSGLSKHTYTTPARRARMKRGISACGAHGKLTSLIVHPIALEAAKQVKEAIVIHGIWTKALWNDKVRNKRHVTMKACKNWSYVKILPLQI